MKRKSFLLLEISCFSFLFLCMILPYISFQREIFEFLRKDTETIIAKQQLRNAICLLRTEGMEEGTWYYQGKNGWQQKKEIENVYVARIKKTKLESSNIERDILFFEILRGNDQKKIWEGWKLIE